MAKHRNTLNGRGQGMSAPVAPAPSEETIDTAEQLRTILDAAGWELIEDREAEAVMESAESPVTAVTSGKTLTIRIGEQEFTDTESLVKAFSEASDEEPVEGARRRSRRVKKQTRRTQRNRRNLKRKQLRKLTTRRR